MAFKKFLVAAVTAAVLPTSAMAWWDEGYAHRRSVTLNAGVVKGLTSEVKRAPVLVRLHSGVLDFTQVKPDGSDLRFVAGDDKTPLNYHIERFDPLAELALIWVDVPSVAPGANQTIWLYYGNDTAKRVSDAGKTYDGEYSLVLNLSENAAVPVDQTANANRLTAANAKPTLEGLIAGGLSLNAQSQVRVAPSASLNVPAGGKMTVSAWVKPAAGVAVAGDTALYTKLSAGGEGAPSRLTVGLRDGAPFVRLGASEAVAATPLPEGTWAHVAVTADGETVTLFVNGVAAGSFAAALPELGGEEVLGTISGVAGFTGDVDEVNRANAARSAAYIALQAQSQGRSSGFATVATEAEEAGAANHDYMRILVSALTPDAWAVIILLTIMSVISWIIMVMKGQMFGRTNRANRKFLEIYQTATRGQGAHTGLTNKDLSSQHPHASVARLFSIGQDELRQRMTEAKDLGSKYAIAPQSVAAIRSALDAGHVREEQRLAKWMVLLTIAISGGPFLGLLGTVLGVMITFAGVAAAGEVNITAIAPGIAAALLATVAGLAVAIPALFGYNYLTSQLDNISADNQVFVDELEKRIAETYRNSDR
ncbi:DUF2341 domain-containing protein [Asticcacaulis sp. ZE23SCel15]|uniref:DUF2341 domain-containing protein n=1 Tax=Asticcacaulis sp. ZE23SCel15 TaxID=3059027 RepID=UPI00265EB3B0|nr:DUF2341 domain-containing protein [Asticcacaulis sp. ZE23SCel15]WKL58951.1 DUF2341 domain-containing protein [Asticcacaulis sp. ZE23SCel15]